MFVKAIIPQFFLIKNENIIAALFTIVLHLV